MKLLYSTILFITLFITVSFTSCTDDKKLVGGISGQSWTEGKTIDINAGKALSLTFIAMDKWNASSSEKWCEPTISGNAGESTLELFVSTGTDVTRTATITINVIGYNSVSFNITQKAGDNLVGDVELNRKVNDYLKEMYLWNDEYKELTLDFNQNYDDFFYGALGSMQTRWINVQAIKDIDSFHT